MMRKSGSYRVRAKAVDRTLWSRSTTAWCFSLHARSAGPATAQSLVELDDGHQVEPAGGRERQFGVEEAPLGDEHVQIICEPPLVTQIGNVQGRPQCRDLDFVRERLIVCPSHLLDDICKCPHSHRLSIVNANNR